ncbi:hypothetical protein M3223_14725 [Paenibacillus pasadenensis]|uniref:hypothetical protein n=1 Tax=Paenibacillus pasadenensis TaxID=217090 RepID=UPI00203B1566|nr:hypothetical protein [Paenibacillus pasadenensis]MCM3748603.1 hypothetical protein [Paenibacillus pasadenensis]
MNAESRMPLSVTIVLFILLVIVVGVFTNNKIINSASEEDFIAANLPEVKNFVIFNDTYRYALVLDSISNATWLTPDEDIVLPGIRNFIRVPIGMIGSVNYNVHSVVNGGAGAKVGEIQCLIHCNVINGNDLSFIQLPVISPPFGAQFGRRTNDAPLVMFVVVR